MEQSNQDITEQHWAEVGRSGEIFIPRLPLRRGSIRISSAEGAYTVVEIDCASQVDKAAKELLGPEVPT